MHALTLAVGIEQQSVALLLLLLLLLLLRMVCPQPLQQSVSDGAGADHADNLCTPIKCSGPADLGAAAPPIILRTTVLKCVILNYNNTANTSSRRLACKML
ncbi:hypothetical protein [Massilia sp. PWRC2]|uniref:hypothetical protein n=1 Tax=Massilia sp. PWRC2 TaxID=2804626 RepID=UPI003CF540BD